MPRKLPPTLLVVGGGFAGRAAIRHFLATVDNAHIVLIDEKPFFEFSPSTLRCLVHPGHIRRITFPQQSDPNIVFLLGRVTHITRNEATVSRREPNNRVTVFAVPFDFCIWATGVNYAQPIRMPVWRRNATILRRRGEFGYFHHRIVDATEILILGAGPIGVELAAEITSLCRAHPSKRLILAASPRGVLSRFPQRAGMYATNWLEKRGVRVLKSYLKKELRLPGGRFQYTDPANPSVSFAPDLLFDCTGAKDNGATGALVAGGLVGAGSIQRDGSVLVLDTLQIPDAIHVFVAGDAHRVDGELEFSKLACEKTAYAAEEAGRLAARNVVMLMKGERLVSGKRQGLEKWPADGFLGRRFPRLAVVSLGKWCGVLCVGPVVVSGSFVAGIKLGLEVLGVASAEQDGLGSLILGILEGATYLLATFLTFIAGRLGRWRVR